MPSSVGDGLSARRRISYPVGIRRVMARKHCLWRQYKRHPPDTTAKDRYYKCQDKCKQKLTNYEIMRENKIIQSKNQGRFCKYVNSKLSNKSGVGMLKNEDGVMITDDVEHTNLLNNFLCSTNSKDNGVMPCMDPPALSSKLDTVDLNYTATSRALRQLKTNSSNGPDGLPPNMLKNLASELAFPLSLLFQSSMSTGQLPAEWKADTVSPIHKSIRLWNEL